MKERFSAALVNYSIANEMLAFGIVPFSWFIDTDKAGKVRQVAIWPVTEHDDDFIKQYFFWIADDCTIEDQDGEVLEEDVCMQDIVERFCQMLTKTGHMVKTTTNKED